jgi:hypothetical protein
MEQLIIFLLFVIGSIISSVIQHKKKKAEAQQQRELEELTRRPSGERRAAPPAPQPQASWPRNAADWQEQLRRMLEGEAPPPPVIKPVLLPPERPSQKTPPPLPPPSRKQPSRELSEGDLVYKTPLTTSAANYERASNLHANVQERMRAIAQQTTTHKVANVIPARSRSHSTFVDRLKRNPAAMREAFIASIIFAPPQGLDRDVIEPLRS